jgi:hypothetical protein
MKANASKPRATHQTKSHRCEPQAPTNTEPKRKGLTPEVRCAVAKRRVPTGVACWRQLDQPVRRHTALMRAVHAKLQGEQQQLEVVFWQRPWEIYALAPSLEGCVRRHPTAKQTPVETAPFWREPQQLLVT